MTNFANNAKTFKLPIENIPLIQFPHETIIAAAVIGSSLGVVAAIFHMIFQNVCCKTDNTALEHRIEELEDRCIAGDNEVEELNHQSEQKDKDLLRLNHELTCAHEEISLLQKKIVELKESYTSCRASAEEFVKMFREKTD